MGQLAVITTEIDGVEKDLYPVSIPEGIIDPSDKKALSEDLPKIKDKTYDSTVYSGLGRAYLKKNMVDGVNILTQAMISFPNTVYIIEWDFDLNGETLEVPADCVLDFRGGSFSNGTIIGNESVIDSLPIPIFDSVTIQGTFNNEKIYSEWFVAESDMDKIKAAIDSFGKVDLLTKTYNCDKEISVSNVSYIKGDGAIIKSTVATQYKFKIFSSDNLEISGITFDSDMISRGALHIVECGDIYVTNCTFKNHAQLEDYYQTDGQLVTDVYNRLKVYGCVFENIGKDTTERDNLIRCISDQNGESSVIESCKFINANQAIVAYTPNAVISKCYFCNIIHNGIYAFKKNLTVTDNTFSNVVQPVAYCDIDGLTIDSNCIVANNVFINSVNRVIRINGDINILKVSNNIITCDKYQGSLLVAVAHDYLSTVNHVVIQGNRVDYTNATFYYDYSYSFISFAGNYALGDVVVKDNQLKNSWRSNDYVITYEASTVDGTTNGKLVLVDNIIESTNEECTIENFKRGPSYIKYNNYYKNVQTRITAFETVEVPNTTYYTSGTPRSFKFAEQYPTQYFIQNNPYKAGDIIFPTAIGDNTDFGKRVYTASDGTKMLTSMPNGVMYDISSYFANSITGKAFIFKMDGRYLLYVSAKTTVDVSNYGYLFYNIPSYIYQTTTSQVHIDGGYILLFADAGIQLSSYTASTIAAGTIIRTTTPIVIYIGASTTSSAKVGLTKNRPTNVSVGYVFFDTVLGKPIWYKGSDTWVDATGTEV